MNDEHGEAMGETRDSGDRVRDLEGKVAELGDALAQARRAIDDAERRRAIEAELLKTDAVDLETARLMTEAAMAGQKTPDVARAVSDLRRSKPFLFKGVRRASAMGPRGREEPAESRHEREAKATGDRAALLRYLRAKRGA